MSSVKYKLDSLMMLRALQVVVTTEIFNAGLRLELAGIGGSSFTPTILALMELGLLIIIWAMRASWRYGIDLYIIFMTCIEVFWILEWITVMPYLMEQLSIVSVLLLIRGVVLIRFNYVENKGINQPQDVV